MIDAQGQSILLARMRQTIGRYGWKTYVAAPILEPTDAFFPDRFTPDLKGVRTVMRRLMRYAGLGHLAVDVMGEPAPSLDPLAQNEIVLSRLSEQALELAVVRYGRPEDLPVALAHECARAYRLLRRRAKQSLWTYRAAVLDDGAAAADEDEEEEISLASVYLGFGLLAAMGAHRYRVQGSLEGRHAVTRWVHSTLGALAPDEACFLLAVQAIVREEPTSCTDAWRRHLEPNERAEVGRLLARLDGERDRLVGELGLPPPSTWPARTPHAPEPLEDDGWEPASPEEKDEDEDEDEEAPASLVIERVSRDRRWSVLGWTAAGLVAGALAAIPFVPLVTSIAFFTAPAILLGAYYGGRAWKRPDACSGCESILPDGADRCSACGGRVHGTLGAPDTPEDGGPAEIGSAIGASCPQCGWVPDGKERWVCDACDAPRFDTFRTGATCPGCGKQFEETSCPACGHLFPYALWWPEDGSED